MVENEHEGAAGAKTSDIGADALLRVLRGEPLEIVARGFAVTEADPSGWRDAFLEAGAASLKSRARDDRDATVSQCHANGPSDIGERAFGPRWAS